MVRNSTKGRSPDFLKAYLEPAWYDVPMSQARIAACRDLDVLRRWLIRAATAASTEDIFAEE